MQEALGEPPVALTSWNYWIYIHNIMWKIYNKNFKKWTISFDSSRKHELHIHSMDTASNLPQHRRNEKAWPQNLENETEIKAFN